jgi:hypothetical protein
VSLCFRYGIPRQTGLSTGFVVTSGQAAYLRTLPLKRLQHFIKAYNLNPSAVSAIEKEDFVELILKAKDSRTGTMSAVAEVGRRILRLSA